MASSAIAVVCIAAFILSVASAKVILSNKDGTECGPCDSSSCIPPVNCAIGMVKDHCGCCFVCGRREGERCDHESFKADNLYGSCGENLECRVRTDMAPDDPPEALCFCKKSEPLCGSDGNTYENECQLTEARYLTREKLRAVTRGPCKSVPKIVSAPEDVHNKTGSYVALMCEARGWPVPVIDWKIDHGDGELINLPSDDSHIAVQSRGGPLQYEVTSWLQLMKIIPEDDATYSCTARNELGEETSSAHVHVIDAQKPE